MQEAGSSSLPKSTEKYLANLIKTFVIYALKPFFSNSKQEVVKASKTYFIDSGIRNSALESLDKPFGARENRGSLLESAVLKELLVLQNEKKFSLKFWSSMLQMEEA